MLGKAPEFIDNQQWFNTPGDKPLTLASLRGRVVLVDFWTYSCINCIRTLPYLKAWDARYRKDGLTIVGVHTPEFPFEREAGNVAGSDRNRRHPLSGGPGQRIGDLERLRQPVLAGRVLHRRAGQRPLRPLRRGRIRREGEGRSATSWPKPARGLGEGTSKRPRGRALGDA